MPAMANTERIYLRLERPGFPVDIAGIYLLEPSPDGPLPFEQVRALFLQRRHLSPLWTRMIAHAPLGIGEDRWTQAATIDIDAHMHELEVPAPGDLSAVLETVLEVSKDPLDQGKPLWEAWYLTGLADGGAALLLRTHHAIIDGMGLVEIQGSLFDSQPTPVDLDLEPQPVEGRDHPSLLRRAAREVPLRLATQVVTTNRIVRAVRSAAPDILIHQPMRAVRASVTNAGDWLSFKRPVALPLPPLPGYVPSPTDHPPFTLFNGHVSDPTKSMAVVSLPFDEIKRVRRAFPGVTVNDILLALITGAMRDYLSAHDGLPDEPIRSTCPVNLRIPDTADPRQGNHITTIWIDLPVHLSDPSDRMRAVSASATKAKSALPTSQAAWETLADFGDLLFPGVVAAAMAFAGTRVFSFLPPTQNLTVSTINGSGEPLYLATRQITHMFTRTIICPPIHLFFSSITYNGSVDLSVTTVKALCPDPEALTAGLRAELDRLLAVASGADRGVDAGAAPDGLHRD